MHYIVFDLEWNQAEGRIGHEGGLPFEIVEIGAVKLNRRMQIVDRFEISRSFRGTCAITGWMS